MKWSPKYVEQCKFALQSLLPHTAPYFSHLLVKHLVTGFFYEKPQQPRLKDTVWDANIVLDALAKYPGYEALAMAWHSVKLTLLILLSTMARKHVLPLLDIDHMTFRDDCMQFVLTGLNKTSRPTKAPKWENQVVELVPYVHDRRLCPVKCLIEYLNATKYVRKADCTGLFLSSNPPFQEVKKATYSGWVKKGLAHAGIDLSEFALHSTRGSSASTAFATGVSINDILARAGWASMSTFMAYYARNIHSKKNIVKVHSSFFGTNREKSAVLRSHANEVAVLLTELQDTVKDQNPARQKRNDPVLLHDPAGGLIPQGKNKEPAPLSGFITPVIHVINQDPLAKANVVNQQKSATVEKPISQQKVLPIKKRVTRMEDANPPRSISYELDRREVSTPLVHLKMAPPVPKKKVIPVEIVSGRTTNVKHFVDGSCVHKNFHENSETEAYSVPEDNTDYQKCVTENSQVSVPSGEDLIPPPVDFATDYVPDETQIPSPPLVFQDERGNVITDLFAVPIPPPVLPLNSVEERSLESDSETLFPPPPEFDAVLPSPEEEILAQGFQNAVLVSPVTPVVSDKSDVEIPISIELEKDSQASERFVSSDNAVVEVEPVIRFSPPPSPSVPVSSPILQTTSSSVVQTMSSSVIRPVQVTVHSHLRDTTLQRQAAMFQPVVTKSCSNATVINVDIPKKKVSMEPITVDSSDSDSDTKHDVAITHICKPVTGLDVRFRPTTPVKFVFGHPCQVGSFEDKRVLKVMVNDVNLYFAIHRIDGLQLVMACKAGVMHVLTEQETKVVLDLGHQIMKVACI